MSAELLKKYESRSRELYVQTLEACPEIEFGSPEESKLRDDCDEKAFTEILAEARGVPKQSHKEYLLDLLNEIDKSHARGVLGVMTHSPELGENIQTGEDMYSLKATVYFTLSRSELEAIED
jgi:hypothetical protein